MKRLAYVLLFVSVVLLIISAGLFFFGNRPLQTKSFDTSVEVTANLVGFDLNGSSLTFGKVVAGGSATRNLVFSNDYSFPVLAVLSVEGNIGLFLSFDEVLKVEGDEQVFIPVTIVVPRDTSLGFYSGKLRLDVRRI